MFERLYQVSDFLNALLCFNSEELKNGVGVAHGSFIKIKMPSGELKTIKEISTEKDVNGDNEVIILI